MMGSKRKRRSGNLVVSLRGDKEKGTNNFVDTEGEQDSESTGSSGKKGKEVTKKMLVVTRSGRVVKVGNLRE